MFSAAQLTWGRLPTRTWGLAFALGAVLVCPLSAWADGKGNYRRLAPGVETTIPPDTEPEETISIHDLVELRSVPKLEWTPNYSPTVRTLLDLTTDTPFRRDIWCLEFTFKPLRMISVDVPQPSGKMQRKLIWYSVYRVKNTGQDLIPTRDEDGTFTTKRADVAIRFLPQFVLESHEYNKAYLDRVIPVAIGPIRRREDPRRPLLTTVEIAEKPIPSSHDGVDRSVWGVVTWEDLDPRIDFFSIYVQGLTNAYRWVDPPGAYTVGDPPGKGRRFTYKTLQLNFWRPGDQYQENEKEIRFGTPRGEAQLYGVDEGVDYVWVYR